MKQKVMAFHGAGEVRDEVEIAISMGWLVQSITCNNNAWVVVLYKDK